MLNANINKTNSHPSKNLKSHEESEAPTYLIIQKHSCVPRVLKIQRQGFTLHTPLVRGMHIDNYRAFWSTTYVSFHMNGAPGH